MNGIIGTRILQCSDGHQFTSSETKRLFGSVHLGPRRLMRCPVDGRFRWVRNVDSRKLTPQQREDAARYHS